MPAQLQPTWDRRGLRQPLSTVPAVLPRVRLRGEASCELNLSFWPVLFKFTMYGRTERSQHSCLRHEVDPAKQQLSTDQHTCGAEDAGTRRQPVRSASLRRKDLRERQASCGPPPDFSSFVCVEVKRCLFLRIIGPGRTRRSEA